jgi:hypothetical protein
LNLTKRAFIGQPGDTYEVAVDISKLVPYGFAPLVFGQLLFLCCPQKLLSGFLAICSGLFLVAHQWFMQGVDNLFAFFTGILTLTQK